MTFTARRRRMRSRIGGRRSRIPRRPRRTAAADDAPGADDRLPYLPRDGLLSRGELAFFRVLRRAVAGRFLISIKTRLCDVIKCPDELFDSDHGRRLTQKHVDFLLLDSWTCRIVAAVELDDRSHLTDSARARDRFKERALQAGGVTLIRIRAAARYDAAVLWSTLHDVISGSRD